MAIDEIKKICLIGAGSIGCWNSLLFASAGYECAVYDLSAKALASAPERQQWHIAMAQARGMFTPGQVAAATKRISYTSSLETALEGADLVSESVLEKIELKRKVHQQIDALCPPHVILTTNSSSLLVSDIEDAVSRRDRFAALHTNMLGRLMEVVPGPETDPEVIDILTRFIVSCDQAPVVMLKEKDGYLANSMLFSWLKTSLLLVADGYGSFADVDRSWCAAQNAQIGPIALVDGVGLDLIVDIFDSQHGKSGDEDFKRAADFLRTYLERGLLGMKSGEGFYHYPDPAWQQPDFIMGR
ncbi:MAG: hypothetical protein KDI10_17730 [Halioglobus sp.]|nr:hypothetical protein [Halioglobus sp.]